MNTPVVNTPQKRRIRILVEWLIILFLILGFGFAVKQYGVFDMLDLATYDKLAWKREQAPDSRIAIIEIDDKSLSQLGRWPWHRRVHAQFLDQLSQARTAGVFMNILFIEPSEHPEDDQALAKSIQKMRNLVLPAMLATEDGQIFDLSHPEDPARINRPLEQFTKNTRVGLVAAEPDIDNVLRRMYSAYDVQGQKLVNSSLLLLEPNAQPEVEQQLIPYTGGMDNYDSYSYIDVLNGIVPISEFTGKYVLIGATAKGLGSIFRTPFGMMSGVEIQANVLDGLLNNRDIAVPSPNETLFYTLLPIVVLMLGFLVVGERWHLYWLMLVQGVVISGCAYLFVGQHIWVPATTSIILMALAYVLWIWRRIAGVMRYFDAQIKQYNKQNNPSGNNKNQKFALNWTLYKVFGQIEALQKEQRQTQALNRELIAYLSHDLRTPQVSILSSIALYKKSANPLAEKTIDALHATIEDNVHKTLHYAKNLVELNHVQSGKLMFETHHLQHIVDYAVEQLHNQAKQKRIELNVERNPELESWVNIDGELIERALVNLISNAIRYSPSDSQITIRLQHATHDGRAWASVSISDQGQGMSQAQQDQLLGRETASNPAAKAPIQNHVSQKAPDAAGSMGIGWRMIRSVIQRHNGRLDIDSTPNQGSTVTISLPLDV
ncbi:CHASE2 domain-containing protein [Hydromonas duriensis]|uniref:histidine kinase n=1 Tax=Hydromonas duriensis TaxID=1527608 RepID=A0A4R6Y7V4_9BURK|nr:CHASE2 domain-containing protein [Hydromonas duriensis]TDR31439.1 CHASE2 domain-containing sensor protein [Hydromonas duriensis]